MTTRLLEGLLVLVCVFCAFLYMGCMDESENTTSKQTTNDLLPTSSGSSTTPTVTSVSPTSGPLSGGTTVTIRGTNFAPLIRSGVYRVDFGGSGDRRGSIVESTDTELRVVTPAGAEDGPVNVRLYYGYSDTNFGWITETNGFRYHTPPTVASVEPASGPVDVGTPITIFGTGFQKDDAGTNIVTVDGRTATNMTVESDTKITVETPVKTPAEWSGGRVDVVVRNDNGTDTLPGGFTYQPPPPTITSVTPTSGPTGGGTVITITGTGFLDYGAGSNSVTVGGQAATNVPVPNQSDTEIKAETPAGSSGAADVVVSNNNGSVTLVSGFTYTASAPTLTAATRADNNDPANGPLVGGTSIVLTGTNFQAAGAGTTNVTIDGNAAASVVVQSDTQITADAPAGTVTGAADIVVSNDNGSDTLTGGFFYTGFSAATNYSVIDPFAFGGEVPISVAVGTFDGDANLDLAVVKQVSNEVAILFGDGTGGFGGLSTFTTTGFQPAGIATADFNGGSLDLVVANASLDSVSFFPGDGTGGFGFATDSFTNVVAGEPVAIAVGDFSGGGLDVVVANQAADNVSLLVGDGAGNFSPATNSPFGVGTSPSSVVAADLNSTSNLDLMVANSGSNNVSVLLGDGTGDFAAASNFAVGTSPADLAVGDFDGDTNLDLAVANDGSDNVSILAGDGGGNFGAATHFGIGAGLTPDAIAVADFDGDGNLDVVVANYGSNDIAVLLGDGTGSLGPATIYPLAGGTNPTAIGTGDFDGDGATDLVVVNEATDDVSILLGITPP